MMSASYANVSDIRPGLVISEDVFINTTHAIIKRDTKITREHIEVLHAFNVQKVKVKGDVVKRQEQINKENTSLLNVNHVLTQPPKEKVEEVDIETQYNEAVASYKKEFTRWRAGTPPDIAKIRVMIMPLIKAFNLQRSRLTSLSDLSNLKDYLYHHAIAVGVLAFAISKKMKFPEGQALQLGLAGVLADCGMAKIDASIMEKAAFLTQEEDNEVKKHTIYSYQMIQETPFLRQEMKLAILQHHERLDGSGYPRGDKLNQISVLSQILAVADVFHAMTSERQYRSKQSPFKVLEMIKRRRVWEI